MQWISAEIASRILTTLDAATFVELAKAILREEATQLSIPQSCLDLNSSLTEPDGGVDARCVNAPFFGTRIVPRAFTDYQFRSGVHPKSIAKIVENDIVGKPGVVGGLRSGHAFVFLTTWDKGAHTDAALAETTRKRGIDVEDGQIVFVGRESLASMLTRSPGLIARYIGVGDAGVIDFMRWSAFPAFSNDYQVDDNVRAQLAGIRDQLAPPASTVRIVGAAGDGKTRLALEALRDSPFQDTVLYARQVDDVKPSLISHLVRTKDIRCTLVVDEVDTAAADRLIDLFASRPPAVRLVLVGLDASDRAPPNALQVQGLSDRLLASAILSIVPGLGDNHAIAIAHQCERSPKLAVLIANRIREDPGLALPTVLYDGSVRSALERYLPMSPGDITWRAVSSVALLMRLGWADEVEEESAVLFAAVHLEPIAARLAVEQVDEQFGIAPLAGRYRYVSPAILGDYLASQQLRAWTRQFLTSVFAVLTPPMADSFARRARRLAATLPNKRVVEEVVLGNDGPFRSLDDLETTRIAFVLRHLAPAFPDAALAALERCIGEASIDALRAATESRRDAVWALEALLWHERTFERASRLLLQLAVAENETWGNNASGTWVECFQTYLGRTAAPWPVRLRAVQFAAGHPAAEARMLAARAIAAAFQTEHLTRLGMPPRDPGMPVEEWRPKTYGEWFDSLVAYLGVLAKLLADETPEVARQATKSLGRGAGDALKLHDRVFDRWLALARTLHDRDPSLRRVLLQEVQELVDLWEGYPGSDEEVDPGELEEYSAHRDEILQSRLQQLRRLQEDLVRGDFSLELQSALAELANYDRLAASEASTENPTERLRKLASVAVQSPNLLMPTWEFLLSDSEWSRSLRWIELLGETDERRVLEEPLVKLALTDARAKVWMSLYDLAYARTFGSEDWIDGRADALEQSGEAAQAFDLLMRSDPHQSHLDRLKRLAAGGAIPASLLSQLAYSHWRNSLSPADVNELISGATSAGARAGDVAPLLAAYLHLNPDAVGSLQSLALRLLNDGTENADATVATFRWEDLAKLYVRAAPLVIGRAALARVGSAEGAYRSDLSRLLLECWNVSSKREFFAQVIAPALEGRDTQSWWQRKVIRRIPLADAGVNYLLDWVAEAPSERASTLADVLGAPTRHVSDLHAALLDGFSAFGVPGVFQADFLTGTFMGNESDWLNSKLNVATAWLDDPRPAINAWARGMVAGLQRRIEHAKRMEEEERFRE